MDNQEILKGEIVDYFLKLKNDLHSLTTDELSLELASCIKTAESFKDSGQIEGLKKLCFIIDCIKKELKLQELGFNHYLNPDTIEDYINMVQEKDKKVIGFIELERFERVIPKEIVNNIVKTKDIFTQYYVLFTDYSGNYQEITKKEREKIAKEKDPILFGAFRLPKNSNIRLNANMYKRLYYLGDWVDEYCDLTLEKFVSDFAKENRFDIIKTINEETLEDKIKKLDLNNINNNFNTDPKKPSRIEYLFNKITKMFG